MSQNTIKDYLFSTDHKIIALQYLITGLFMALVGGLMSYVFRMQQAYPGESVPGFGTVTPGEYNMLLTNHGTIMIFWVAMPMLIAAFGNFLIPLMIGCDDMVFPRLNRLSYQIFFVSTIVLIISWFVPGGGFAGSWTSYPPLSARAEYNLTPWGSSLWLLAVALEIVAFLLGGINFVTTTMNSRAPGMTMYKIPIVVWMINIAVLLFMFSVGPLVAGAIMLLMDQQVGTSFFVPSGGGDPVLFQHLFWFFGHPEVYVILLPEMGLVAEIMTTFSRKKLFGYKYIVFITFLVGCLSMIVWAHHQFIAGIDPRTASIFSFTTILISIPISYIFMSYIATLYGGQIDFQLPMLWALAMIGEFLVGGLTGLFLGASALNIYFHDNIFTVAHFHYALIPIVFFGGFAGIYYWYPKMFGRMLNQKLGQLHFWGTTITFNCIFIPLFLLGLAGQHRKIFTFAAFDDLAKPEYQEMRVFATQSLIVALFFQIPFIINFFMSMKKGELAGDNPWKANTLEWATTSPAPHGNFDPLPTVYRGPYEYSLPDREEDYFPQHIPSEQS
ncbi:MAG: cytochrome c oxidase subunit I [Proteobacteria bacterium]|nr:cytochrome c oxidase subunit I [Pseudomonadota bacterium]